MARPDFHSVDEYIASQPEAVRGKLRRVRSAMRNAAPGAEETISYKIPAYKLQGRVLLYFAGWKEHYALYPADGRLVAAFGDELTPFLRSKGTLRFSFSEPVPVQLIGRIVRFRAQEITRRAKSKPRKRGTKPARSS